VRFVNRVSELAALQRWWELPAGRSALVWGRRRVGKTALLQQFAKDKVAVFQIGAGRPIRAELGQFSDRVGAAGLAGVRDLASRPYVDWDDALEHLAERASGGPVLLVLDEFPELVASAPDLPGVLRAFLDRTAGRTGLRLLLCGSAVRSMRALGEERAPLYGRFDLSLQLHPFRPHEAALMLPDLAPADRALVYGLLGGMPLYLSWWDAASDVRANLGRLACLPGAPLLSEGQLVLATEGAPSEQIGAVLHAIAAGKSRHSEIKNWLGFEPTRTLERLQEMRLVDQVRPVTDRPGSRQRRYQIADNFLRFYLGVLSRHRDQIDRGLGESILPVMIDSLDDHLGPVWEEAFRDHLRLLGAAGRLGPGVVAVGPWWTSHSLNEIDAVALAGRSRLPVMVGEAKWARTEDARRLLSGLRRKAAVLTDKPEALLYVLAARERVTGVPDGADPRVLAVTAADVFAPDPLGSAAPDGPPPDNP
jgi:uncharacterized protein